METDNIIRQQLEGAPEEVRSFIAQGDWSKTVERLSTENNLTEEQKIALKNEVLLVLLAMELSSDFQKNIQSSLNITGQIAHILNQQVNGQIFKPIRQFLPTQAEPGETISSLEIPPEDLPMVEAGEVAHDTTPEEKAFMESGQVNQAPSAVSLPIQNTPPPRALQDMIETKIKEEKTSQLSQPNSPISYPQGKDPYREPVE